MPRQRPKDLRVFYHPRHAPADLRAAAASAGRESAPGRSRDADALGPDGRGQPADRSFARFLLRLHAAAEPGGVGQVASEDQRRGCSRRRRRAMSANHPRARAARCCATLSPTIARRWRARPIAPDCSSGRPRDTPHIRSELGRARRHLAAVSRRRRLQDRQLAALLVQRHRRGDGAGHAGKARRRLAGDSSTAHAQRAAARPAAGRARRLRSGRGAAAARCGSRRS